MLRLAIMGTNWISEQFLSAAIKSQLYVCTAVYSRKLESAVHFCQKAGIEASHFDDLGALALSKDFDAVYIASPNSLHYKQSLLMLKNHKHVICEKPLASNLKQAEHLYKVAQENQCILFEAFKTEHLANFKLISSYLPDISPIRKVVFNYCQYSSRYQKYLNGENPNTFNPAFSNGSIMDIGYYCLASAVSLFGKPLSVKASAHLLESGVDAHGSVSLFYPDFEVLLIHSKVSDSLLPSEIQGEKGGIQIKNISTCDKVEMVLRNQDRRNQDKESAKPHLMQNISQQKVILENSMQDEAVYFIEQIQQGYLDIKTKQRSLTVMALLDEIRAQTKVVFPADKEALIF